MTQDEKLGVDKGLAARQLLGKFGADLIREDYKVGLGTGLTAEEFIKALAKRVESGLHVIAVASSEKSLSLALSLGITCQSLAETSSLDIVVDGADQISPEGLMIKGGGGALLREKIMSFMTKRHVILATWTKFLPPFGAFALPLEIFPLAWPALKERLAPFGSFHLRQQNGQLILSDNGNYLVDLTLPSLDVGWPKLHSALKSICGVVETGIFFETTPEIYLADSTLRLSRWQRGLNVLEN